MDRPYLRLHLSEIIHQKRNFMKLIFMVLSMCFTTQFANLKTLSKAERKYAVEQLQESSEKLLGELQNLTPAQKNFKPAADKWSIAEVMEHIAVTEVGIAQIVEQTLKTPTDSLKRAEIKVSDVQIKKILTNRNGKVQAPEILKPTGRFTTIEDAIAYFNAQRKKNILFIETTEEDLRDRFWKHPATGVIDLYQSILLVSAHCERHTAQIAEIKKSNDFPN